MSDSSNPEKGEETKQVKRSTLEALEGSSRFTPAERDGIASTIEAEIAKLLPELPEGIAEIAARAVGLSIGITEKLADSQERPPTDDQKAP